MSDTPTVVHPHVSSVELLRKIPTWQCINNLPFRFLHCIALSTFLFFYLTHVPEEEDVSELVANSTLPDAASVPVGFDDPAVIEFDELDAVVQPTLDPAVDAAEGLKDEIEGPVLWEPKHPQDYVRVVWAFIILFHALVNLFCVWFVRFKVLCQFKRVKTLAEADHVLCVPPPNHGDAATTPLLRRRIDIDVPGGGVQSADHTEFDFRRVRFELDTQTNAFQQIQFPDKNTVRSYLTSTGYESDAAAVAALEKWGTNTVDVPVPTFMSLLQEQMLAPFFVFQVFCVALWCMDSYWYYSLFTLGMLVVFECTVVFQRQRTLTDLRAIQVPKQHVQAFRSGRWEKVPGEVLLPGDVFSVVLPHSTAAQQNEDDAVMPADALLLCGTCVTDEAVLTGESTPQWKEPIAAGRPDAADAGRRLDDRSDKQHLLFGGTKIVSAQAGAAPVGVLETPDGGALAVVLRTGFETAQGKLMRTILFSTERLTANSVETGLFICFLLIFAFAAAGYILHNGLQEPPEKRSRFKLYLNCAMVITAVIPPELPMQLTMAVNNSLLALRKQAIFCTEPFRIPYAGKTEVCCFDKTGTLTSDNLVMTGVSGAPGMAADAKEPVSDASQWPQAATMVLACCHSLANVSGDLVGDPLEKASFSATDWVLSASGGRVSFSGTISGAQMNVSHAAKHHFSSALKRMAVVAKVAHKGGDALYVFAKGAPEVMKAHMTDCPADYEVQYRRFATHGARVIALASKQLPSGSKASEVQKMPRESVESGLSFAGFAVFESPLKPGSAPALRMLADSAHQLVMITGDTPLTACYVAARTHIVDRPVVILSCDQPGAVSSGGAEADPSDSHFTWRTVEDAVAAPFSRDAAEVVALAVQYDFCVTGDGLAHCTRVGVDDTVIACTQVFARVSPDQKEDVIKAHRAAGRTTLMCGDGTNDVGALNAAHVGIALMPPPSKDKIVAARKAQLAILEKKKEQLRMQMQGIPLPPRKTTDEEGNLLPGSKLVKSLEDQGKPVPAEMRKWAEWLDSQSDGEADGSVPLLKPGDASMASPFTVKATDVMPTTDIIKQGRCTLVITMQMFKILGLLCLSSAYSLSVLYLAGVKLGDIQATCQGLLSAGLFFCVANAKPRKVLSRARPHQTIFCVYSMGSLLVQFALQIGFIVYMFSRARAIMAEDDIQTVESEFKPTLVNTVCYIVQNATQLITFAVNYVGYPFQTPLRENSGMLRSLNISTFAFTVFASGIAPELNAYVQLVPIPMGLRIEMFVGLAIVIFGSVTIEQTLRNLYPARTPPRKGYMPLMHLLPSDHAARKKVQ